MASKGRPKLPEPDRKTETVIIRLTLAERDALEELANGDGCGLSEYLRRIIGLMHCQYTDQKLQGKESAIATTQGEPR